MKNSKGLKWKIGAFATVGLALLLQGIKESDAFTKAFDEAANTNDQPIAAASHSDDIKPNSSNHRSESPTATPQPQPQQLQQQIQPPQVQPQQQVQPQPQTRVQTRTRRS